LVVGGGPLNSEKAYRRREARNRNPGTRRRGDRRRMVGVTAFASAPIKEKGWEREGRGNIKREKIKEDEEEFGAAAAETGRLLWHLA